MQSSRTLGTCLGRRGTSAFRGPGYKFTLDIGLVFPTYRLRHRLHAVCYGFGSFYKELFVEVPDLDFYWRNSLRFGICYLGEMLVLKSSGKEEQGSKQQFLMRLYELCGRYDL